MSAIFFGSSEFAVKPLESIAKDVCLVVTQPPKPSGRGRKLSRTPVHARAEQLGLSVETPSRCRDEAFLERVRTLEPLALVVASYGQILPRALLEASKRGGINLHASLLPKYRGAAPIQRAIMAGETVTGVTLMQMDEGCDTGPVIAQAATEIRPGETSGQLELRLSDLAASLLSQHWQAIQEGRYETVPQDDRLATMAPKMQREDGLLRFDETADQAYRRFRACTPKPGCILPVGSEHVLVMAAAIASESKGVPGCFAGFQGDSMLVAFSDGTALAILAVRPPGRKEMSGRAYAVGKRWRSGDPLAQQA